MSSQYERKIILVGKTGNGKSSLGNVLLETRAFPEARSFSAVTKECQFERIEEYISVVDTPGLFDSDERTGLVETALEIQRAVEMCPNPHAFLIVLNGDARLTEEDLLTIDVLRVIFGEKCLKKAIIVLTHIDNDMDQTDLKRTINTSSEMRDLVGQCGGNFTRIDNKHPRPEHQEEIIRLVDKVSKRGTVCFKNEYIDVHKQVLEEAITVFDSRPVHEQIKQLAKKILKNVKKKIERGSNVFMGVLGIGVVAFAFYVCKGGDRSVSSGTYMINIASNIR